MRIHIYPDPVLLVKGETVRSVTKELQERAKEMIDFMYKMDGVGLAAQQVGWKKMVTVFDTAPDRGHPQVLLNPEVIRLDGSMEVEEGCLSFPGIYGTVRRSPTVLVKGIDLSGKEVHLEADGLLAQALQHEIDHLNGILFTTKMTPACRFQVRKQLKKLEEKYRATREP